MQTGRLLCPRDISLDRPRAPSDMLFNLCGPDRLDRVFFVTTKWDRIPDAFADAARRGGESDPAFVDGGASLHHLRPSGPIDTATKRILESINAHDPWEIVHAVLSSMENWGGGHQPLLIQDELVNKNLPWKETTAGQAGKGRGHRRGTGVRALKVNKLHTKRPKATVLEPPLPAPGGRALIPTPAPRPPPRAPPTPPSSTAPPSPTSSPLPPVPPSLPLPQRLRRWVRARMHV
ncbi:hypothetical protein FA13DRAFT_650364 [Coprinellus micaceus]|uniref:Uncharacterized protein n=1 Tax=Coprinellus micaceus TaxID=71717 RepID=A0A4Y7T7L8_COPMI|nr:hypothetical protein FA13DRAFT_650364 [Coprinellus micaceus]